MQISVPLLQDIKMIRWFYASVVVIGFFFPYDVFVNSFIIISHKRFGERYDGVSVRVPATLCNSYMNERHSKGFVRTELGMSGDDDSSENLLEKARMLREEAERMESEMESSGRKNVKIEADSTISQSPVQYTVLDESVWELRFRVRDEKDEKDEEESSSRLLKSVGGTIVLKFKADGYTDIIGDNQAYFQKIWGWDEDQDEEKGEVGQYLLFSADSIKMEEAGFADGTRLYFNIRIDRDKDGIISLSDGKITVKKELKSGFWGVFNSSGILAQFRVIGDFVCKPTSV